jgi:hypothetical protein
MFYLFVFGPDFVALPSMLNSVLDLIRLFLFGLKAIISVTWVN